MVGVSTDSTLHGQHQSCICLAIARIFPLYNCSTNHAYHIGKEILISKSQLTISEISQLNIIESRYITLI